MANEAGPNKGEGGACCNVINFIAEWLWRPGATHFANPEVCTSYGFDFAARRNQRGATESVAGVRDGFSIP